jgi:hypothetical protein
MIPSSGGFTSSSAELIGEHRDRHPLQLADGS